MPIEIITNYIEVTDEMPFETRVSARMSNQAVEKFSKSLKEDYENQPSSQDGQKLVVTLTADTQRIMIVDKHIV